jgi:predicted GIY-YIG superfamily endonuclease
LWVTSGPDRFGAASWTTSGPDRFGEDFAMFHVYILECADGSYYVGHTDDLAARLAQHEAGIHAGYTAIRRPVVQRFCDEFATRDDAFRAERQIKGWSREKKEALLRRDGSALRALSRCRSGNRTHDADEPS